MGLCDWCHKQRRFKSYVSLFGMNRPHSDFYQKTYQNPTDTLTEEWDKGTIVFESQILNTLDVARWTFLYTNDWCQRIEIAYKRWKLLELRLWIQRRCTVSLIPESWKVKWKMGYTQIRIANFHGIGISANFRKKSMPKNLEPLISFICTATTCIFYTKFA